MQERTMDPCNTVIVYISNLAFLYTSEDIYISRLHLSVYIYRSQEP